MIKGILLILGLAVANAMGAEAAGVMKVAVARFSHETCTFCPGGDPGIEDWTRLGDPHRGQAVLRASSYIRGFVQQAEEFGDIELVGLTSPRGVFGGTSRSWNQEEVFDYFVDLMLDDLRAAMPVDGVYLSLHGAMAVRNIPRPEAEIARRFREMVGPNVPIVGTFDLHGNEDGEFLKWADGSFVTKRFPHYDTRLQGERAARYLRRVMRGTYIAAKAVRRPPILTATVLQWTGQSPLMDVMERARRWEDREAGAYVNVFLGFPWADVPTLGTSIHVMTNNDQALAEEIADDMAAFIWRVRKEWAYGEFPQPEEGVGQARAAIAAGETPVVLADYWDRPGDGTWTLRELLDQGVNRFLYAALTDEPALDRIWEADLRPGDEFDQSVGGYTGEQAGDPVRLRGKLIWRGSRWGYDRVAAIAHGDGNVVILVPGYQQITTPGALRFGPIDPDDFDVFVLKSRVHFRRGFDETGYARTILIVDAPGDWFGTTRLEALEYEHVDIRDFYPFAEEAAQATAPGEWTLSRVAIDPRGASSEAPWYVHLGFLNVRDAPSLEDSNILGRLGRGELVTGTYLIVEETDEEWLEIDFRGSRGYISRLGFSRIHPHNQELINRHGNLPFGEEIIDRWWGIPLNYEADDLVGLPAEYTRRVEGSTYRLRREAAESVMEMMDAMRADGLEIHVSSPYRSGAVQQRVFGNRMRQHGLNQRRSAPPGHSEHQLGTTVDFSSNLGGRSLRNSDPQHLWLETNGARFGWYQTYRAENIAQTGYIEEPWHWRYTGIKSLSVER